MSLQIYPTLAGLAFNVKWTPAFFNQSQKAINGASIDIALAATPLHNFELTYGVLRDFAVSFPASLDSEFRYLMGFFMQIGGSVGRFAFKNPDDNKITNQLIGIGDGTTTVFTAVRTFGTGGFGLTEPVGQVDTGGTIQTFVNAVLTSSSLSTAVPGANTFTFASAPGVGLPVTAAFPFFYYCKFADDTSTFEKFSNLYWQNQSVKIQSCRAGA